jgi:hypothetical protein
MASLLTPEGGDDAGYWSDASSLPELVSDDSDLDSDSDSDSEESCHSAGRTQHVAAGDAGLGLAVRVKGGETVDADDPDVDHSEDLDLDFDLETRTSSDSDTSEAEVSQARRDVQEQDDTAGSEEGILDSSSEEDTDFRLYSLRAAAAVAWTEGAGIMEDVEAEPAERGPGPADAREAAPDHPRWEPRAASAAARKQCEGAMKTPMAEADEPGVDAARAAKARLGALGFGWAQEYCSEAARHGGCLCHSEDSGNGSDTESEDEEEDPELEQLLLMVAAQQDTAPDLDAMIAAAGADLERWQGEARPEFELEQMTCGKDGQCGCLLQF